MVIREIKEDLNKNIDTLCSLIRRLIIITMTIFSKLNYEFSAIANEIPSRLFVEIVKLILKYI